MLLSLADVLPLFQWSAAKGKFDPGQPWAAEYSAMSNVYPVVNNLPVLIDFSRSILSLDSIQSSRGASPVARVNHRGLSRKLRGLVAPPLASTRKNVAHIVDSLRKKKFLPLVLVVGGGSVGQGMEPLYRDPQIGIVAFDVYASPYVQFIADAHQIPFPDEVFDSVIVQAVLEHVVDPAVVVGEILRVLKKGGLVYSEVPFLQHVHEGAFDFTRFTDSGQRYLFREFELVGSGATAGAGTQLLWSIEYFFRSLFRSQGFGKFFKIAFFWLNYLDSIIPERFNIDAASGVYFLGQKPEKRSNNVNIISYYQGAQR